jgi:hypothetical protein
METRRDQRPWSRQTRTKVAAPGPEIVSGGAEINHADDIPSPGILIEMLI